MCKLFVYWFGFDSGVQEYSLEKLKLPFVMDCWSCFTSSVIFIWLGEGKVEIDIYLIVVWDMGSNLLVIYVPKEVEHFLLYRKPWIRCLFTYVSDLEGPGKEKTMWNNCVKEKNDNEAFFFLFLNTLTLVSLKLISEFWLV